jgi:hypothetical protein
MPTLADRCWSVVELWLQFLSFLILWLCFQAMGFSSLNGPAHPVAEGEYGRVLTLHLKSDWGEGSAWALSGSS